MTLEKSPILLVLDIDETLVYATRSRLENEEDFKMGDYFVYKRPFLEEFIRYVTTNFDMAIWSSASDTYVEEITERLNLTREAKFCWSRKQATFKKPETFDSEGDLNVDLLDHHYYLKRLKKLKKLGYNLEQILIIDDSPHKSQENYGNAIYVEEFKGQGADQELQDLIHYLDSLKNCQNVRAVEKRNWKQKIKH
ncbi:MAG: HAD family hydrolase [Flavobacteriales bacterium]|nr:HAD family hydrolase [Flavobacteriales bacterium]